MSEYSMCKGTLALLQCQAQDGGMDNERVLHLLPKSKDLGYDALKPGVLVLGWRVQAAVTCEQVQKKSPSRNWKGTTQVMTFVD